MNDLDLVRDFAPDAPLPPPDDLAPARARVLAAMAASTGDRRAGPSPLRLPRRAHPARHLIWAGVTAGVAAAVAAVLIVATHQPSAVDNQPALVNADAARILQGAAASALKAPDVTPRPDQFVYTKGEWDGQVSEEWLSVDGTRDGLRVDGTQRTVIPGCRDGVTQVHGNYHGTRPTACTPDPQYRTDLPTDPDAMYTYLKRDLGARWGDNNAVGKEILDLTAYYLPPRTRSALYEAAARIPGLRVNRDAVDGAGRHGVAITWWYGGGCAPSGCERDNELIFDPRTYANLGVRHGGSASALLVETFVDAIGQRP